MLRIKKEIDLTELEKFGFKYNKKFDCWDYKRSYDEWRGLKTFNMIHIYSQEREIYCSMYIGCNEAHDTTREIKIDHVIFNLTQAGLVEKVEE